VVVLAVGADGWTPVMGAASPVASVRRELPIPTGAGSGITEESVTDRALLAGAPAAGRGVVAARRVVRAAGRGPGISPGGPKTSSACGSTRVRISQEDAARAMWMYRRLIHHMRIPRRSPWVRA